jgi:hypothetical protein
MADSLAGNGVVIASREIVLFRVAAIDMVTPAFLLLKPAFYARISPLPATGTVCTRVSDLPTTSRRSQNVA